MVENKRKGRREGRVERKRGNSVDDNEMIRKRRRRRRRSRSRWRKNIQLEREEEDDHHEERVEKHQIQARENFESLYMENVREERCS